MCIWRRRVSAARLTVFNLFAQFKTTKSHENYAFLYPFFSKAISPPPLQNVKTEFYTSKLYGLTGMDCCSQTGIIHSCLWAKSFQLSVFTLYTGPEIERKTACISSMTCNLYTCMQNWELCGVLSMMQNTLWWSQNEVWVKRVHNPVMSWWNKCYYCVITVNDSVQTN